MAYHNASLNKALRLLNDGWHIEEEIKGETWKATLVKDGWSIKYNLRGWEFNTFNQHGFLECCRDIHLGEGGQVKFWRKDPNYTY